LALREGRDPVLDHDWRQLDDATASNYEVRGVQILSTNPSATATAMSAFISWPKVRILPGVL
jgi:hypothetical protein